MPRRRNSGRVPTLSILAHPLPSNKLQAPAFCPSHSARYTRQADSGLAFNDFLPEFAIFGEIACNDGFNPCLRFARARFVGTVKTGIRQGVSGVGKSAGGQGNSA